MTTKKKMLQAAAGSATGGAGGAALDITDVFSTYLYEGNGAAQVIENGINLGDENDGGSVYFNGNATGLTASPSSGLGSGDFTVEFFVYPLQNDNETYPGIFDCRTSGSDASGFGLHFDNTRSGLNLRVGSVNNVVSYSTVPEGEWTHLAIVRSGTSLKMYANGTSVVSVSSSADFNRTTWYLGRTFDDYNFYGYISNARIVGSAVYTSDFTAPTGALTSITNTELLTCQGDAPFVDNSTNGYAITQFGDVSAATFGPFDAAEAGEGGLVWIKNRDNVRLHALYDTERGVTKQLNSNLTDAERTTAANATITFNADGFSMPSGDADVNGNTGWGDYASWTFRKAPKFFDVVTWTGDNVAGRTVSHNLGSAPGVIIVKRLDVDFENWRVYHRSLGPTYNLVLNNTSAATQVTSMWNNTAPTSTEFTLGSDGGVNSNNRPYVAYLFAHNDGDGEFGPDGNADVIKCGSFSTSDSGNTIDLGFEPQFVLWKLSDATSDWQMFDSMRGMTVSDDAQLEPNTSDAELTGVNRINPTATGFTTSTYAGGFNIIYIAIRRGPLAPPESGTEVFDVDSRAGASGNVGAYSSGFPVDMAFHKVITSSINPYEIGSRLTQGKSMNTTDTSAEVTQSDQQYDYMDGWNTDTSASSTKYSWMWKRAPGFCDVVAYSGNSTAGRAVSHNLGVAPEMIWMKCRTNTQAWQVYHKDLDANGQGAAASGMGLNLNIPEANVGVWNSTSPTDTSFYLNAEDKSNETGQDYIAYLFASLDGVSKVGSYSGNSSASVDVDCGFTSGARFVLIKNATSTGDWWVIDTVRGLTSSNDGLIRLNSTAAEVSSVSRIDPYSSGFTVTNSDDPEFNRTGNTYIFYAIA